MQIDDLKLLVASKLDVTEFLDLIGFTMFELVEALEEEVVENMDRLVEACE